MSRRPGWLVDQLPPGMVDEDFFRRFVTIFEEQADTLQAHGDNLEALADTRLAPAAMLPWLASWIGVRALDGADGSDDARQRDLLRAWAATLSSRGTPAALRTVLTALCGPGVVLTEGGGVFAEGTCPVDTAWLDVSLPSTGGLDDRSLLALVLDELPAHVRTTVRVAGTQIYPALAADDVEGAR